MQIQATNQPQQNGRQIRELSIGAKNWKLIGFHYSDASSLSHDIFVLRGNTRENHWTLLYSNELPEMSEHSLEKYTYLPISSMIDQRPGAFCVCFRDEMRLTKSD